MGGPALELTDFINIPEFTGTIFTDTGHHVGAYPFEACDPAAVSHERGHASAGLRFPYMDAAGTITGGNKFALRPETHGGHPVGMFLNFMKHLSSVGGEDTYETIRTAVGDVTLVRGNIGGQYGIKIFPNGQQLFALGDIPYGAETQIGTAAAADHEELAVGAEVDAVRISFRERDDARDFQVVGIIKKHLPLSTDGHKRRPWIDGDGGGDA